MFRSLLAAGLLSSLVPGIANAQSRSLSCAERALVEQHLPVIESALDPLERLRSVEVAAAALRSGRSGYPNLTDAEWKEVEAAGKAWELVEGRAAAFEAKLPVAAVEAATAGEKGSFARAANRLYFASKPTCTAEDFQRLEKNVGLARLAILAPSVERIVWSHETWHEHARAMALSDWLASREEEEPGATELAAYYRLRAEATTDPADDDDIRSSWSESERRKLRANRVRKEEVDSVVGELFRTAPGCFLGAHAAREEMEALAVTKARGKFHLEQLADALDRGDRPTDTIDFVVPEDASPLEQRWDGYREDFRVRYEGDKAVLYSFGPDRKNATDDDIVVGTVPVPPKR